MQLFSLMENIIFNSAIAEHYENFKTQSNQVEIVLEMKIKRVVLCVLAYVIKQYVLSLVKIQLLKSLR